MPSGVDQKTVVQLTQRALLGDGFFHIFVDDKTGGEIPVQVTEEEYDVLALPNVEQPMREGCSWKYSVGGAVKCDSPTGYLGEKEYVLLDGKALVSMKTKMGSGFTVPETDVVSHTVEVKTVELIEEPVVEIIVKG